MDEGNTPPRAGHATRVPFRAPHTRHEMLALAAILGLALGLRLWQLGEVPPGLHVDEGHNGVDALRIVRGWRPLFLPGNDGREALYSYMQAPLVAWLGPTALALRLASALLGVAGVWATWLWVRQLPLGAGAPGPRRPGLPFAVTTALATAFVTATTYWHLHFSRIGIRGILLPLVATLAATALWTALRTTPRAGPTERDQQRHPWAWIAAGGLYAVALYAHPAGRVLALAPCPALLWLAWRLRRDGPALRRLGGGVLWAASAAVLVLLPLSVWAARQPEVFLAHAVSVSVLDPAVHEGAPARRIAVNAWRTVRALAWRGSGSWYHNLRDRPVLDPFGALLWGAGVWWWGRRAWRARKRRSETRAEAAGVRSGTVAPRSSAGTTLVGPDDPILVAVFVVGWVGVMALPTVMTSGAPNFSRAVGVLPALLLPVGLAVAGLDRTLAQREWGAAGRMAVALALLMPSAMWTATDHFVRYARAEAPRGAFGAATTEKAALVREWAATEDRTVLSTPLREQRAVLRFLTDDAGPNLVSVPQPADVYVPATGSAVYAFDPDEEAELAATFTRTWPETAPAEQVLRGRDGAIRWRLLPAPAPPTPRAPAAFFAPPSPPAPAVPTTPLGRTPGTASRPIFGDTLALVAVERRDPGSRRGRETLNPTFRARPGDTLELVLWWQVLRSPDRPWTRFTHLVAESGVGRGQHDGSPFGGALPMTRWRAGDIVGTWARPTVNADAPVGTTLALRVGWHVPDTGERLPLPGDDDAAAEVARIELR